MEYKNKVVSVVVPCYKQAIYLPETLDSLLKQTHTAWEAIIVNDGSPDNTEEVALKYVDIDSRFSYVNKPNGGLSSARNTGISLATGEFILPLDSDDIIQPEYIEEAVNVFEKAPETKLVYCLGTLFGVKTGLWDLSYSDYKSFLIGNTIFCSAVYRREDALRIGGYDENMLSGYEDWDFFIRLLQNDGIVYQISKPLFNYRIKTVSMATSANEESLILEEYIYLKHRETYFMYYGGVIERLRELNECKMELEALRKRVERYKNKWYRRLIRYLRDFLRKIRGRQ